jgi:hypothetical protein
VLTRRTLLGGGLALAGLGLTGRAGATGRSGPDWDRLRGCLTGDLVLPADAAYPAAKQLDSGYFDTIDPQGVAYRETVDDIRTVLSFAQHNDLHWPYAAAATPPPAGQRPPGSCWTRPACAG